MCLCNAIDAAAVWADLDEKSLPPGGRGTTKWWKEPAQNWNLIKLYGNALSLTRLRRELPPGGSLFAQYG